MFVLMDLETTGFDPEKHEILQVGVLIGEITEKAGLLFGSYQVKIIPENLMWASKKALEINHYNPEIWEREAIDATSVYPILLDYLTTANYIGFNNPFDLGFLRTGMGTEGFDWREPRCQYDVLTALARPLKKKMNYGNAKLDTICDKLDVPAFEGAHDALGDVKRTWVAMWKALRILTGDERPYDI